MGERITFAGLDVHKATITVALAEGGERGDGLPDRPGRKHGDQRPQQAARARLEAARGRGRRVRSSGRSARAPL